MANCPRCNRHLSFFDIKAECPYCGVNIPNYNWEARLDEDAVRAEKAWSKFRITTGNLKSSLFGGVLRIVRFVCTFLPLIALVLPAVKAVFVIPLVESTGRSISLLTFVLDYLTSLNLASLASLSGVESVGSGVVMLISAVVLMFLAVVFGVANFVFVLINAAKLKAGSNIVLCLLSTLCFAVAAVLLAVAFSSFTVSGVNLFNGSVGIALPVGVALFTLNTVLNIFTQRGMKKQKAEQNA